MDYYLTLLYVIAIILVVYKTITVKNWKEPLMFIALFAASVLLFNYEHYGVYSTALLSGFIIFNMVASFYGKMSGNLILILALYFIGATWGAGLAPIVQAAVLGVLSSPRLYGKPKNRKTNKRAENLRNIFQISAGIFFVAVFLLLPQYASLILLLIFMGGICVSNYVMSSGGGLLNILSVMEREGFDFGHGAFWLGVGALFAAGFLGTNMILVVFSGIFFADSFSTLAGINFGSTKLPYNKKKSVVGTLTYFITVLVISYFVVGYWAVPLAVLAALIESAPLPLDDNFSVSLVLTTAMMLAF